MIARIDLYSGNNYKNKQTQIIPFDIDNEWCILNLQLLTYILYLCRLLQVIYYG
jgi:hypothetical protein